MIINSVHPSDFPSKFSVIPGHHPAVVRRANWPIMACHGLICVTSSLFVAYFVYKKLYKLGNMSWKKTAEMAGPIDRRLRNLDKERAIWYCYLEWIEDYCGLYYGLLNHLNSAAIELDAYCSYRNFGNLSECSGVSQSDRDSDKEGDSQYEGELSSELDWEKMTGLDESKTLTKFAKILGGARASNQDFSCSSDKSYSILPSNDKSAVDDGADSLKGTTTEDQSEEDWKEKPFVPQSAIQDTTTTDHSE